MAHIFISCSSKHRTETGRLAALLEKEGYAVWWDVPGDEPNHGPATSYNLNFTP
jgi:hypothetical protein